MPSIDQLADDVFDNGKYLAVRAFGNYYISLYALGEKFYEVWFLRPDIKIKKIEELTDMQILNHYIDFMQELDKHETT